MDTVKALCEQTSTGKLISQIKSNIKKDGPHRKTEKYCEERLINLQLLFDKFSTVDAELKHHLLDDHPYRVQNYYKQVKDVYEETKNLLLDIRKAAAPGQSEEAKQQAQEDLENEVADASSYRILSDDDDCKNKDEIAVTTLNNKEQEKRYKIQMAKTKMLKQNLSSITKYGAKNFNKPYCELKIKQLTDAWKSYSDNHEEIIANATEAEFQNEYFENNWFEETQTKYELCLIEIHQKLEKEFSGSSKGGVTKNINIKLPTIEIPLFYGDYKQWTNFYGLFSKTVHQNENLSNEERMYYLFPW